MFSEVAPPFHFNVCQLAVRSRLTFCYISFLHFSSLYFLLSASLKVQFADDFDELSHFLAHLSSFPPFTCLLLSYSSVQKEIYIYILYIHILVYAYRRIFLKPPLNFTFPLAFNRHWMSSKFSAENLLAAAWYSRALKLSCHTTVLSDYFMGVSPT